MRIAATSMLLLASLAHAATLEKLSIEEMAQKATRIVRGRVTGCSGQAQGLSVYTHCVVSVTETWKGQAASTAKFVVPGGTAAGLTQIFTGTPKFAAGEEYVLFLWTGRSGITQIIGLSQGVFDLGPDGKGKPIARRPATSELMLDKAGNPVRDENLELQVSELRRQVDRALNGKEN
jgi:hypothetical protein